MIKQCLFGLLASAVVLPAAIHAADLPTWAAGYDPATKTRYIPVELWTGAPWDGVQTLNLAPAHLSFGKVGEKRITGPIAWVRPSSGETLQVYERNNRGKKQLFALSSRGDGLGRVFDSRYGRDCVDEVKFPLGRWRDGEVREFDVVCNGGKLRRKIVLTIENLDFSYNGVPHSLQFHWVVDGGKQSGTDMHYTYSPERGLVTLDEN